MLYQWRMRGQDDQAPAAEQLAQQLKLHSLVTRLLVLRGLSEPGQAHRFLHPRLTDLHDPALLPGCEQAARRICRAIRDRQTIVIYGDYDVDGITAAAILWHTLRLAGADVRTYVPHRIEEGYGLNCAAVEQLCAGELPPVYEGQYEEPFPPPEGQSAAVPGAAAHGGRPLLISVDCGITAVEPAKVARAAGVDLIITDHHEFDPQCLPEAHTLVHPRLPGVGLDKPYPFDSLCGAGVALKLAWQVARIHCGSDRVPEQFRTLLLELLSLAALGTIADVVPLVDENRIITAFGLSRIKQTRFEGLNALIDASRLRDEKIDAYHVGFVLGPRLNACGRMGHAQQAVHLLTAADGDEAMAIAEFLTSENDRRRATERQIFHEAREMIVQAGYDHQDHRAIVLGKEGWHVGVIGIVASRLVDAFCRPVVLLNFDNGSAHGSARSVDGISIHEAFQSCANHLTTFGGHAMAAGLHLKTAAVDVFRAALVSFVNQRLKAEDLVALLCIDACCELADVTVPTIQQIQHLAPFGRDNPAPMLCVRHAMVAMPPRRVGQASNHLSLTLRQDDTVRQTIGFGMGHLADKLRPGMRLDVAFEVKTSVWQGVLRPEMHVRDLRIVE